MIQAFIVKYFYTIENFLTLIPPSHLDSKSFTNYNYLII